MSEQTTLSDSSNATSSPVLVGGALPCDSRDGMTIDLFGQEVALASHSVRPEEKPANLMSATFGRIGQGSSASQSLQRYLESKLQAQLPLAGSMKPFLIWKRKNTPALRQYCQLALSAPRTKEIGSGLLPTPVKSDATTGAIIGKSDQYYTTATGMPRKVNRNGKDGSVGLGRLVQMWPTPQASDNRDRGNLASGAVKRRMEKGKQIWLSQSVSPISGALNPMWVAWLMGYPQEWVNSAPSEMPSSRKSRRNLSEHQCNNTTKGSGEKL